MGITVVERCLPGRQRGRYVHSQHSIVLNTRLHSRQKAHTFGHELGHAHYGHEHDEKPGSITGIRQERKADEFAAKLLIDSYDYEVTERMYGPHVPTLAVQLGVTAPMIYAWQSMQRRQNARAR
ncbi:ImmA/IrrE family metallo-endopeptidase [Oerskovia enterophila]